jgi:predicted heme/steroid binding protein
MKLRNVQPITIALLISSLIVVGTISIVLAQRRNLPKEFDETSVLPPPITQPPGTIKVVTADELAKNNGKNGNNCYVAVDGLVYEIRQGMLWNNGKHDTSNNQAYCGADMSAALKTSPHGAVKIKDLPQIGTYQP